MQTFFHEIVFGNFPPKKQKDSNQSRSITVSTVPGYDIHKELPNLVLLDPIWEQDAFNEDRMEEIFTLVSPITGESRPIECWGESEDGKTIFGGLGLDTFQFEIEEDLVRFFNPEGDMEISRKDCKIKSRFFFTKGYVHDNHTWPFSFNTDLIIRRSIKTNLDFKEAVQDFIIHFYMEYMKATHTAVFNRLVSAKFRHFPKEDPEDLPF